MKLVDKSALVAEIERRRESNAKDRYFGRLVEDNYFLNFIDTLEVKEVDLNEEIDKVWDTDYEDFGIPMGDFYRVARRFYELGLQAAQNGEKL